jgi:hypothetical protein
MFRVVGSAEDARQLGVELLKLQCERLLRRKSR